MTFVVQMLAHTPPYVYVLLAYLVWQACSRCGRVGKRCGGC